MRKLLATALAVGAAFAAVPLVVAPTAAPAPRSNPVIRLLEQSKPVFSTWANYIGVGKDYHVAVTLQNNKNYDSSSTISSTIFWMWKGSASSCGRYWTRRRSRRRA